MERIGREVERELARGGSHDAIPLAALTAAWPEVVGDAIARQAWPLRIARDGTLHVATSSATWANELGFLAGEIVERLRARLGPDAPTRLRCAVGPVPESPADEARAVRGTASGGPRRGRCGGRFSGRGDRRSGAPRAGRASRPSEPSEGPVRPRLLIHLPGPAIWLFAGLF